MFEAHVRSDNDAYGGEIERLGDLLVEACEADIDSRWTDRSLSPTLEGDEEAAGDDDRPRVRPQ